MRGALCGWVLLSACSSVRALDGSNPTFCDPRPLSDGEVRARRMPCASEAPDGGDGRASDWLLENAHVRFVIRGSYASLTRLGLAGGTVIDAVAVGDEDALVEATPTRDGLWFTDLEISAWNEDGAAGLLLSGTLEDGNPAELEYRLEADDEALHLSVPSRLVVVPAPGSVSVGASSELGADGLSLSEVSLFASNGSATGTGAWPVWEGSDTLFVGDRERVYAQRWPTGIDVSGTADGTRVEAADRDGVLLARLPVTNGVFSGRVPVETLELRACSEGLSPGPAWLPGEDLVLEAGDPGFLQVRVTDDRGRDLPATLFWGDEPWPLAAGGGTLTLGPGAEDALLWAGPSCDVLRHDGLSVAGTTTLDATLSCDPDAPLLADLGRESWPDPDERRRPEDVLFGAAAEGVGFAVLVADDEVAPVALDRHTAELLLAEQGSRADTDTLGALVAWPWSPDTRDHAHGAVDWPGIEALPLLSAMTRVADRIAVVSPAWVAEAGSPSEWSRPPRGLRLDGLDDLGTYTTLLDARVPIAAVGARTWIEGLPEDPGTVDIDAMLVAGRTVATNGPRVSLRVDGAAPGASLAGLALRDVSVQVYAPSWMPLSGAALLGTGGEELARWTLTGAEPLRLDTTLDRVPLPEGWVLAVVWGDEAVPPLLDAPAWAITSPVWLGRP